MTEASLMDTSEAASEESSHAASTITSSSSQHRLTDAPEKLWERAWVWLSERANPIVVKEIRQSLKSKQFTISFGLTLIASMGWTLNTN